MSQEPILRYPGSKYKIAKWTISHFPEDYKKYSYLESHAGGLNILLNKEPSVLETANDISGDVYNLFKIIRDRPDDLAELIRYTPWSRVEYENIRTSAKDNQSFVHSGDGLEDARRFFVRCWMAFGAKTSDRTSWAHSISSTSPSCTKRWNRLPEQIVIVADRLKNVQLENMPAKELIKHYRKPDVLIYCDPPYLLSTRSRRLYKDEMTVEDHEELLNILKLHPGPVYLAGYENSLYNSQLKGWVKSVTIAQAEKGKPRQEVLWINTIAAEKTSKALTFEFNFEGGNSRLFFLQ